MFAQAFGLCFDIHVCSDQLVIVFVALQHILDFVYTAPLNLLNRATLI